MKAYQKHSAMRSQPQAQKSTKCVSQSRKPEEETDEL